MATTTTTTTKVSLVKLAKEVNNKSLINVDLSSAQNVLDRVNHINTITTQIKELNTEKKDNLHNLMGEVLTLINEAKQCPFLVQLDKPKLVRYIQNKYQFKTGALSVICDYLVSGLTLKISEYTPTQMKQVLKAYNMELISKNEVKKLSSLEVIKLANSKIKAIKDNK